MWRAISVWIKWRPYGIMGIARKKRKNVLHGRIFWFFFYFILISRRRRNSEVVIIIIIIIFYREDENGI